MPSKEIYHKYMATVLPLLNPPPFFHHNNSIIIDLLKKRKLEYEVIGISFNM